MAETCFLSLVLLLVNGTEGESRSLHCFIDAPNCAQARSVMLDSWRRFEPQLVVVRAGECEVLDAGIADADRPDPRVGLGAVPASLGSCDIAQRRSGGPLPMQLALAREC